MISPELDLKPIHDALQVGLAPDEICIREGIVLKICEESRFPFEFFCWRSPPMVKEMDCFIKYSKGRERLLDVGAFHGLFSLVFTGWAWATEPFKDSFEILAKNFALNKCNAAATAATAAMALSDEEKIVEMHLEGGHLVDPESRQYKVDCPQSILYQVGDKVCEFERFKPNTIKIDVEGHEVKVLRGLQETIFKFRPIIFIEIHLDKLAGQGESIKDVADLLTNYKFIYTGTDSEVDLLNLPDIEERDPHFVCLPV